MKIYLLDDIDTSRDDWTRMQSADIDKALGRVTILESGIENGLPWIDIENSDLETISESLSYSTKPTGTVMTKLAFRRLFTQAERIAFDNFESDTKLSDEQKAFIRTFRTDLAMAEEINLNDEELSSGVEYLETCGLLSEGRAAEVLAYCNPDSRISKITAKNIG